MPTTRASRKAAKAAAGEKTFRFHSKKAALTWSAPSGKSHPIASSERILAAVTERHGAPIKHLISREKHKNGENHFHAFFEWGHKLDSEDVRLFDIDGVHPNIKGGNINSGWLLYVGKDDDYITDFYEKCPFATASNASSVAEGLEHLWKKRPREMLLYGDRIESNLRRRIQPEPEPDLYFGPFPPWYYPPEWNPRTHALLLTGDVGTGKTQFARYLMSHLTNGQGYHYWKKHHEQGKKYKSWRPFILDEVYMLPHDAEISREITDVENGGTIDCRNSNYEIPPGIARIFLSNYDHPFKNPKESVYGRRVVSHRIEIPE